MAYDIVNTPSAALQISGVHCTSVSSRENVPAVKLHSHNSVQLIILYVASLISHGLLCLPQTKIHGLGKLNKTIVLPASKTLGGKCYHDVNVALQCFVTILGSVR